jgi:multiple sugar transport system substrate-binding protein
MYRRDAMSRGITRRDLLRAGGGLAAAAAVTPLLASRGADQPDPLRDVTLTSTTNATGTVTFWTTMTGIYYTAHQHIVNSFNASQKRLRVSVVQVPTTSTDDVSKLLTAVRGGTGPDLYFLDRFTVSQQAGAGALEDLSKYVKTENDLAGKYLDYAWKEVLLKGSPYGIPCDTDARGMFYNKTMLQSAGIDPAELDVTNGPITLDRMNQINVKLNKTGSNGNYSQVGVVPWFDQGEGYTWGFDFGASFANFSKCSVTPTASKVVEAYQWVYDWAKQFGPQQLASFISAYAPTNAPPATYPFFVNRTALSMTGDWVLAEIQQYVPKLDYGITYIPVPKKGDKPTTWSGGFSLVVPQGAKNADGAWEFIRYMAGETGQRYYTTSTTHMPTWKSLVEDKSLYSTEHLFFIEKLLPITRSRPPLPVGALYWDQLQDAESEVQLNSKPARSALEAVESAVQPQLQRYCPLS